MKIDVKTENYEDGLLESIDIKTLKAFNKILLMPDTHIGKGVPIGFVGQLTDKVIVIGCVQLHMEQGEK